MIKRSLIITALVFSLLFPVSGQEEADLKREVTLYNPYKPTLPEARKKSYLPEIIDVTTAKPEFRYEITPKAFSPVYAISPIKSASLLPDPLTKLYKSYIKLGAGNNNTPLGEISITSHRSKKGAVGFYAKHFSSNGKVPLENKQRVFAGLMDNDASLFGKKFFRKNYLDGSVDFIQRSRYAYGYNTDDPYFTYLPSKKSIMTGFFDIAANVSFASLNLDSTDFSYDFDVSYDYLHNTEYFKQNHTRVNGQMAKIFKGFYVGSELSVDHFSFSDSLNLKPKYLVSAAPFVRKSTDQWNFNLGLELLLERNILSSAKLHIYPDVNFGFSIVPEYMRFFGGLGGKMEVNDPMHVFSENPFLVPDGNLFKLPNTDHSLIISAGLKGNNGIGGNYLASVSYSLINNLLLYSNIVFPDTASRIERGNYFIPLTDEAELLNFHGEFSGVITDRLSFNTTANYYKYTLSANPYAWNKPGWDGKLALRYNLRDKIIAGTEIQALGNRKLLVSESPTGWTTLERRIVDKPVHFNMNISAEYRYTKILSFWVKLNNISFTRYYEWEYYPSQMFNFLVGFSYSL